MRYPCGYRNDPRRDCHCTIPQIEKYMSKISGPLLDRLDIQIEVPAVPYKELSNKTPGTSSADMRKQVVVAREAQKNRFQGSSTSYNRRMNAKQLRTHCVLDAVGQELLRSTMAELGLSARAHDKILRVARTIADLEGAERIAVHHLSEAVNYRQLDRAMWS